MRVTSWRASLLLLLAWACTCGDLGTRSIDGLAVTFDPRPAGNSVSLFDAITVDATATDPIGVTTLVIQTETRELARCDFDPGHQPFPCEARFTPSDVMKDFSPSAELSAPVVPAGELRLFAVATSPRGTTETATLDLKIVPPPIRIAIQKPLTGAQIGIDQDVELKAEATDVVGVGAVILVVGRDFLKQCNPFARGDTPLACEVTLRAHDHLGSISTTGMPLFAKAIDPFGNLVVASVVLPVDLSTLRPSVIITEPKANSAIGADGVTLSANALSGAGIDRIDLQIGPTTLRTCSQSQAGGLTLACTTTFRASDFLAQVQHETLRLTAQAFDGAGVPISTSVDVILEPPWVEFRDPVITQPTPAVAFITSAGALSLTTTGAVPMASAVVTDEKGATIQTFTAPPFAATIQWSSAFGNGPHTLTATVTDKLGRQATATRDVELRCKADADCASGQRCCIDTGACHPTVAAGADCDCAHPCPSDQGCFPGTCNQTPRKCRPGCFPGTFTQRADVCAPQGGTPTYCSLLPLDQQTPANKGGACAPADACDIDAQNCPDLPLDRTMPAGPGNPAVPHTCVPVTPGTNACMPAGPIAAGGTNCGLQCFAQGASVNCARGSLCVQDIDTSGNPFGPSKCYLQCTTPSTSTTSHGGCPGAQFCTGGLQGAGGLLFTSGICR